MPLRENVQKIIDKSGVSELVWMAGDRRDVAGLLSGFDVFVMPSLNEGISNTVLEAMATGLPVVATEVGGNPELVQPNQTGVLVPADDVSALADAIGDYVDDSGLRRAHGDSGRRAVEERFSLRSMVSGYLSVYDELVSG